MIKSVIFDFGGVLAKPKWTTEKLVEIIQREIAPNNIILPSHFIDILKEVMAKNFRKATCSMIEIPFEFTVRESLQKVGIEVDDSTAYKIMMSISNADLHEIRPEAIEVLKILNDNFRSLEKFVFLVEARYIKVLENSENYLSVGEDIVPLLDVADIIAALRKYSIYKPLIYVYLGYADITVNPRQKLAKYINLIRANIRKYISEFFKEKYNPSSFLINSESYS